MAVAARNGVSQRTGVYRVMRPLSFADFSGGWNIRDAPSEMADNESPSLGNVTLTERGSVAKRLGYERAGSGTGLTRSPSNVFYWKTGDVFIVQDGAAVKQTQNFINFTTVATFSTTDTASFCDFQGRLIVVHPVDRVFIYDQHSWDAVPGSPRGSCIAVWQNKVWVSGSPVPDEQSRVWASNAGNPAAWNVADDYNDMREKNHAPVTALGVGQGMDISGRPGLLVFKRNWVGRINDPKSGTTFGQYTTLHNEAGACGPRSVTSALAGVVCSINERGIWAGDGINGPQLVSSKISPLFESTHLNLRMCHQWCAERDGNRVIFSVGTQGADVNNMVLEYNPEQGWIVPHNMGFSSMTLYSKDDHVLYGGSPLGGKVFKIFSGWSDDGADITACFQTKWFEPQGGYSCRLRRMRVRGRGVFNVYTKRDYDDTTLGPGQAFNGNLLHPAWGEYNWGAFNWTGQPLETFRDLYSWGVAKSFSISIWEKSQLSAFSPTLLGNQADQAGSFGFHGVLIDYVRLGYS